MPEMLETVQTTERQVTRGVPLTTREELWMEMARDSFKNSATVLNDTLQKLAALTGAMTGGLVILRDPSVGNGWRLAVIVCLLASLACSVRGMFPRERVTDLDEGPECKRSEEAAIAHKALWLKLAGAAFAVALLLAVTGIAVGLVFPAPSPAPCQPAAPG